MVLHLHCERRGASWLVRSSPGRAVRVRALVGNIALCSWAETLYSQSAYLHPGV